MTRLQRTILALLGLAVIITYGAGIIIVASGVLATPGPLPNQVAASGSIWLAATPTLTATPMPTWTLTTTSAPTATATLVVPCTPTGTSTGTPTGTFTPTPTDTPSPTAAPTATPTLSSTAAPTPTSTPLPPQIQFYAEKSSLVAGECTNLHWHVEEVQAVYLNGTGVAGQGIQKVCPKETTAYTLRVIHRDGHETINTVSLEVIPLPSPTPLTEFPTSKGVSLQKSYCQDVARLGGAWNYNWSHQPVPGCEAGFVPMICGRFSDIQLGMAIFWATQSGWLLGFNEPDRPEQANIAPEEAATLWRRIEEARPSGVRLISPVTAQGNLKWLRQWRSAYYAKYNAYPHVDAWAFHYYGGASGLQNALSAMIAQLDAWGESGEIWVTEFGRCDDKAVDFMESAISIFKASPRVTRYAWFTNRIRGDESWNQGGTFNQCALLTMDGQLRPLGQRYAVY
jgi:hypothetical protein